MQICSFVESVKRREGERRCIYINGECKKKLFCSSHGFSPQLEEQGGKDHEGAGPLQDGEAMLEDDITGKHGAKLAGGHDSGVQEGAVHVDGVSNGKLACDGREGEHGNVRENGRKAGQKGEAVWQGSGQGKREDGNASGGKVDVKHLIVHGHVVAVEKGLLLGGSDGVEQEVQQHEQEADGGVGVGGGRGVVCGDISRGDHGGAAGEDDGDDGKVVKGVVAAGAELLDEHDWKHFCTLADGDGGEGEPLERLVLAGGGDDVGDGDGNVLCNGGDGLEMGAFSTEEDCDGGHGGGEQTVCQDEEERVREEGGARGVGGGVGPGHDALLEEGVEHEGGHDGEGAEGGVQGVALCEGAL